MQHTSKDKRIKTHVMGYIGSAATGATDDIVADTYVFQDDVRLIGVELNTVSEPRDAHSNTDSWFHAYCELSRSGRRSQDGSIARSGVDWLWNGVIAIGLQTHRSSRFFAEGYGYDFDEGESINLLGFATYIGVGGVLPYFYECILYWVER